MTLLERLIAKMSPEPNTGCWLWTGVLCKSGYGKINVSGSMMRAHRVSWAMHRGPVPGNLHVLHRCDQPACVNPDHLFLGTNRDNVMDAIGKGRWRRTHQPLFDAAKRTQFPCGDDHPKRRAMLARRGS